MSLKVNVYDPTGQSYAPRIRHEDWERHRSVIRRLHAAKTPRKVMLQRLREDYHFTPTLGQLQAKCKEWNLKVYAKEGSFGKSSPEIQRASLHISRPLPNSNSTPAFHLTVESGFVKEWSDDYRIHRLTNDATTAPNNSLPPEYIGGGLLANTVDSHWPVPEDDRQCEAMLQAGHFYHALNAYQQSFSIYRAVYLYQRRHCTPCDPLLIRTILHCACAAVTNHQRNIMHSVLCEIGSSADVDRLSPLLIDCLQSASLNMVSSDSSCDIECGEVVRARATAFLHLFDSVSVNPQGPATTDIQGMLYRFEHALLIAEHETKLIQKMLDWCELAIDRLHREIDDIFVGHTTCEDEYHRRISQVLSGYLLSEWHKRSDDYDDTRLLLVQPFSHKSRPFRLNVTTIQTLVALAFIVVDAVRCDPLLTQFNKLGDGSSKWWFLDGSKLFKRGIKMLNRLDDRSRCAVFAEAFLERFYTSVSYRQEAYRWTAQLPAVVDSVGMALAQENITAAYNLDLQGYLEEPLEQDDTKLREPTIVSITKSISPDEQTDNSLPSNKMSPIMDAPSPVSECNSIASFMNTYHRTLRRKFNPNTTSGMSTPGDVMSLSSSTDFKFGVVTNCNASTDVDSLWHIISSNDSFLNPT